MSEQKLSESSVTFMIASLQEAHNYLRDTSKRMTDHIQFYLTITTALLAGLFIMLNSQLQTAPLILSVTLLCALQAGIGFITFARLTSIKVQASIHFARSHRWSQYFLENDNQMQRYFAGEGMLRESGIRKKHFPFTHQIVLLLRAFALFNSVMLALSLSLGGITVMFSSNASWPPSIPWLIGCGVLAFAGLIAALVLSNLYLNSQVRTAWTDFTQILEEAPTPTNHRPTDASREAPSNTASS